MRISRSTCARWVSRRPPLWPGALRGALLSRGRSRAPAPGQQNRASAGPALRVTSRQRTGGGGVLGFFGGEGPTAGSRRGSFLSKSWFCLARRRNGFEQKTSLQKEKERLRLCAETAVSEQGTPTVDQGSGPRGPSLPWEQFSELFWPTLCPCLSRPPCRCQCGLAQNRQFAEARQRDRAGRRPHDHPHAEHFQELHHGLPDWAGV